MKKIFILIGLLTAFAQNCTAPEPPENGPRFKSTPVVVGILYDISASVQCWPELDERSLREIAELVGRRGGMLAAGTISEKSFQPLLKYDLKLDSVKVEGTLSERARINQANIAARARFDAAVERLLAEVREAIVQPRSRKRTDLNGALERYNLLFQEPSYRNHERVLCILSDGKDTVRGRIHIIPDAQIYAVGWQDAREAAAVFGEKFRRFESLPGLIKFLKHDFQEGGNIHG